MKISTTVRKHVMLFIAVLFTVIILDQLIAMVAASILNSRPSHPGPSFSWGSTWIFPDAALRGAAAYNDTLTELWFAETITFILAPLVLICLYQRFDWKFWTPWVMTGLVAVFAIFANFDRVYSRPSSVGPPQFTEILHDGANSPIHHNLDTDYMLESEFWEFLPAQLLFIIPFGLGYLASTRLQQSK